jgi:hypothetical protein
LKGIGIRGAGASDGLSGGRTVIESTQKPPPIRSKKMKGSYGQKVQDWASKAFNADVNVDEAERLISAIGGGAILLTSANLRSLRGLLATMIGASLVYRGVTGHSPIYSALGLKTCGRESGRGTRMATSAPEQTAAGI